MAVTKRSTKGAALTHAEMDANWDELMGLLTRLGTYIASQTPGANQIPVVKADSSLALPGALTVNTDALVVASSKNVGIGTTNPLARLSLRENGTTGTAALHLTNRNGTITYAVAVDAAVVDDKSFTIFDTTANIPRLALTATGSILINTTADDGINKLRVNGGAAVVGDLTFASDTDERFIKTSSNGGAIRLRGNSAVASDRGIMLGAVNNAGVWTEYARINSDEGNLLVGASAPVLNSPKLFVGQTTSTQSGNGLWIHDAATVNTGATRIVISQTQSTANANPFLDCYTSTVATKVLTILGSGNVQNANNSYGALSDIKLKTNIEPARSYLDDLCKVQIKKYNFKSDPDAPQQIGVIAQELEQIFPGMIEEIPDRDAEGNNLGTVTKSVKYSVFVPMLITAIQTLKAEIDQLKGVTP